MRPPAPPAAAARNVVKVIRTSGMCILRQLRLEEALLRVSSENYCVVNDGAKSPAVVLGISGKPHALLDVEAAQRDDLTVIKRFSGGGTVIVDGDTQFVTLVMNRDAHGSLPAPFPRPIMDWTGELYGARGGVFDGVRGFRLRENDYVVGEKKVGGNAQSISSGRWLHHTSFLFNFRDEMMRYLRHPEKTPEYRGGRSHADFLTPLSGLMPSRATMLDRIEPALRNMGARGDPSSASERQKLFACITRAFPPPPPPPADAILPPVASSSPLAGLRTVRVSVEDAEREVEGLKHHRTTAVVDLARALELGVDCRAPVVPNA